LRHGDVCADVAFLVVDLERLGYEHTAERFITAYEASSGTTLPRSLLEHYVGLRAYVRAKVACLQHEQGVAGADDTARALHDLALRHLRRTRRILVLVGGLPGTGKSTLASGLSTSTGWSFLRSDEVRQVVDSACKGRYAPEVVSAVYAALVCQAHKLLESGRGVILDASSINEDHRTLAACAAADTDSEFVQLRCTCSDPVDESRILARRAEGLDASEATPEVRQVLARRADPWPAATVVDTSDLTPDETVASALLAFAEPNPGVGTLVPPTRHVRP
jgi:hypothetical protein